MPTRTLAAALALLACAACAAADTSCPSGSSSVGTFNVAFTEVPRSDRCLYSNPDGGAGGGLVTTPSATALTVCASATTVYAAFSSAGFRTGTFDGGTFSITDTGTLTGTACTCPIDVQEVITGTLLLSDGGPAVLQADGGAQLAATARGAFDYAVTRSASATTGCNCNVPCGTHFTFQ